MWVGRRRICFDLWRKFLAGAILGGLLLTAGCAAIPNTGGRSAAQDLPIHQASYLYQGVSVPYEIRVPKSYRPGRFLPLVISLHEPGMTAEQQEAITGLAGESAGQNFFILYPRPLEERSEWLFGQSGGEASDLLFLLALMDHLKIIWDIDPQRIYLAAMGRGAEFADALACHPQGQFRAAALVAGRYPQNAPCAPGRIPSVLLVHGEADSQMPYAGAPGYAAVPEVFARWAALNGCAPQPDPPYRHESAAALNWPGCRGGAEVLLFTLSGEGHTWPAHADLQTTDLIWRFFLAH